jgi:hypothetical protein
MSHFTTIKTQLRDVESLVQALADVGFKQVERHETAQHLYGFQGDVRSQTAEVIIRRQCISGASNDIGFKRQPNGSFEAIISEYDRHRYNEQWINQVTQRYGLHQLRTTASAEGFAIEQEEVLSDGTIRVVVGRWR